MARIRSVHPGLYTDEAFATVSISARLLLIGIWSHADDGGGFEWKPLSLKMRIFPADNVDVSALLDELAASDIVKRYEVDGRSYGAVRNFGRWQRPKKPVRFCPMPASMRQYAETVPILDKLEGSKKGTSQELGEAEDQSVPDQYGTSSEPVPDQSGISPAEGRKVGRDLTDSSLRSESGDVSALAEKPVVRVVGYSEPALPRGSRLPADWEPDAELISFARENGCNPDLVSAKFRDYWLGVSGQRGVKLDWRATFRNWCRSDAERSGPKPQAPTRQEKFRETWKDVPDLEAFTR